VGKSALEGLNGVITVEKGSRSHFKTYKGVNFEFFAEKRLEKRNAKFVAV